MLFNIQVYIPRKYSIHWTNIVDSIIKRQDLPIAVKNFLIFCLLPCFYFGMGLLVPVILTQHAESLCKPNKEQRTSFAYSLTAGRCCQAVPQDTAHVFLHYWFCLQLIQHGHKNPQQTEHSLKALAHKRRVHCGVHQGKVGSNTPIRQGTVTVHKLLYSSHDI